MGNKRHMIKPCPFCGSTNIGVSYDISYGHGDSGFSNLRVTCQDCPTTKGASNFGRPSDAEIDMAWIAWNKRV